MGHIEWWTILCSNKCDDQHKPKTLRYVLKWHEKRCSRNFKNFKIERLIGSSISSYNLINAIFQTLNFERFFYIFFLFFPHFFYFLLLRNTIYKFWDWVWREGWCTQISTLLSKTFHLMPSHNSDLFFLKSGKGDYHYLHKCTPTAPLIPY